ncbi:hypothetical protein E2320_010802, partial [Naja naja]
ETGNTDSINVMGGSFTVSQLNETNYLSRSVKMEMYLRREELWMVVINPPAVLDDGDWRRYDKALASIILALEDSQLIQMRGLQSANKGTALRGETGAVGQGHSATQHMRSGSSSSFSLAAMSSENTINTWLLDRDGKVYVPEIEEILHNVLYVPELDHNLLSISSLDSQGYEILFARGQYSIRRDRKA